MELISLPCSLIPHEQRDDLPGIPELAAYIKEHNALPRPLLVDHDDKLIDGHRRLAAAISLGWTAVPCRRLDLEAIMLGQYTPEYMHDNFTLSERVTLYRKLVNGVTVVKNSRGAVLERYYKTPSGDKLVLNTTRWLTEIAAQLGFVSISSTNRIAQVVRQGIPEVIQALDANTAHFYQLQHIIKKPREQQLEALLAFTAVKKKPVKPSTKQTPKEPRPKASFTMKSSEVRFASLMERVGAVQKDAPRFRGERARVLAHYGIRDSEYRYLSRVLTRGYQPLIEAMDEGLIQHGMTSALLLMSDEDIGKRIEQLRAARLAKNAKAKSISERSQADILRDMLSRTYAEWRGVALNEMITPRAIPTNHEKIRELQMLTRSTRLAVDDVINTIEREIAQCLKKIGENDLTSSPDCPTCDTPSATPS